MERRPGPTIVEPTDAIIRLAATCICGSDLWPYRGAEPAASDVLGTGWFAAVAAEARTPIGRPVAHSVIEAVGTQEAIHSTRPGGTSASSVCCCSTGTQRLRSDGPVHRHQGPAHPLTPPGPDTRR